MKPVFITGGTGYIGRRLIAHLLKKGYAVKALVREGSEKKLSKSCNYVTGDPFDASTFWNDIPAGATFIQLLGVAHPGPSKKEQFRTIDLASVKASVEAATKARVQHFIYVSVAQIPTRIMKDFQQRRAEGEAAIRETHLPATFVRPWYVVGPAHYWPILFQPFFSILEWIPSTSHKAKALRLVTLKQMVRTLLFATENIPSTGINIIEIDTIKNM